MVSQWCKPLFTATYLQSNLAELNELPLEGPPKTGPKFSQPAPAGLTATQPTARVNRTISLYVSALSLACRLKSQFFFENGQFRSHAISSKDLRFLHTCIMSGMPKQLLQVIFCVCFCHYTSDSIEDYVYVQTGVQRSVFSMRLVLT